MEHTHSIFQIYNTSFEIFKLIFHFSFCMIIKIFYHFDWYCEIILLIYIIQKIRNLFLIMSTQRVLALPEILENIFSYITDYKNLVKLLRVNYTWQLEAVRAIIKFYRNMFYRYN